MADPTLSTKFLILLGDGEASETFAHPCGANARSVKFTNNLGEDTMLDCSDPAGETAVIERWLESQDAEITISGRVATESFDTWREWVDNGTEKNIQVILDEALADNGGYWSMAAYVSEFEMGAENKATATFSATIMGSGRRTWTDAAA